MSMQGVTPSHTGLKLKKLRAIHGLEQKHIADKLAISQSYYSKIETFSSKHHLRYIPVLAAIYNISEHHLIEWCALDEVIHDSTQFLIRYEQLLKMSNI